MIQLTPEQFDALAELIRMRPVSQSYAMARQVLVDGSSVKQIAREWEASTDLTYQQAYNAAHQAVDRVNSALELVKIAGGR